MATNPSRRIFLLMRIGVPLLVMIQCVTAKTVRVTKHEGEGLTVTCPSMPGDLLATSFIKKTKSRYVTLFSRRGEGNFQRPRHTEQVSLNEDTLTMTVSNLNVKDDGATYSCKAFSPQREVQNNVVVTIVVPPKINFTVSPRPPYEERAIVTVTCVVDRVLPALQRASMALRIADQEYKDVVMTKNSDNSYRYVITKRHLVTKNDDRKETDCRLRDSSGKQYRKMVRILLVRPPSGKPTLAVSKTVMRPGDQLKLTCNLKKKGVPPANKYTWFKNNRAFKNTAASSHTFRVTSQESAGSFSCKGANAEGASNVSMPQCVAFTKEHVPGSAIPLWISIVSILLNIAALFYVVMVHIKPRVTKYMEERQQKSLKRLNDESKASSVNSKNEENKNDIEATGEEKGNPEISEKPADHAYSFDAKSGVPNNLVHVYDQVEDPVEGPAKEQLPAGKDREQLGQEYVPAPDHDQQANNEDIRL